MRVGLDGNLDPGTEVWYDYLNVPQGDNDLKLNILRAIPQVFANASSTFVELDDVHSSANNLVRFGTNTSARVLGITSVCNATWFKRVWSGMEYIRSNTVKIVTSDGRIYLFEELLQDVFKAWDEERELLGDVHALEGLAGIGTNIVPWNLGPLHVARLHKKIDFGSAFMLLSRRGCWSRGDFFHALLGIVKADFQGDPDEDPVKATLKVATECLAAGDYSPLLVVPAGYIDILAFGLQPSTGFPDFYPEFTFGIQSSHIKLEKIGTVEHAVRADGYGPFDPYIYCMHIALQYTGPVVDTFVETLWAGLYNLPTSHVSNILSDKDKCSQLIEGLEEWYNAPTTTLYSEPYLSHARRIADILGLNRRHRLSHPHITPTDFMFEHGGTLHNTNPATLIAVKCSSCNNIFAYRFGLYRTQSEVRGSVAYRILGLNYHMKREDGLGILVKDGVITGRLLWASRACGCRVTEMVEITLRGLPLQRPRDL